MEGGIAREASQKVLRKTCPLHAIEAPDASSDFVQRRPFSTHIVSKVPGLPVSATPVVKPLPLDKEETRTVQTNSPFAVSSEEKECSSLTFFARSSTFPVLNSDFARVKRQNRTAISERSPSSCSSAPTAATSSDRPVRGHFSARSTIFVSSLPQSRPFVTACTGRNALHAQRRASSGSLTCRTRGRQSRTNDKAHLLPFVHTYDSFHSSPIPAYTEASESSGWRVRLRTHVVRRPRACSDVCSPPPSSTGHEAGADFSDSALPVDVAFGAIRFRNNRLRLSPTRFAAAASPPCGGTTWCSEATVHLPHIPSQTIRCKNGTAPDPPMRSSHEHVTRVLMEGAATGGRASGSCASIDTSSNRPCSRRESTGACHERGDTVCRNNGSMPYCLNKPLGAVESDDKHEKSSTAPSASRMPLGPLLLSSASRLSSVKDKQASVVIPRTVGPDSCLNKSETALKSFSALTDWNASPQYAVSADGGRKTDIQPEQSSCNVVPKLLPAKEILAGSALQTEKHAVDLAERSSALRKGSPHSHHAKQHPARQAQASTSEPDVPAPEQKTLDSTNTAPVAEGDEQTEGALPRSTGVTNSSQPQPDHPCEKTPQKTVSTNGSPLAANGPPSLPCSLLVQQADYVQRPLMPPPSPPRFCIPLRYRLPLHPAGPPLSEGEPLSLDDEERNARPGLEFPTVESCTLQGQTDDLLEGSCCALTQCACTGPDTPLTCGSKTAGTDSGAANAATASADFGTDCPAAPSAAENYSDSLKEVLSAPHSARGKTFDTISIFQGCANDLKSPACFASQPSSSEEAWKALSRIWPLEQQRVWNRAGETSKMDDGSDGKLQSNQRAASEIVSGDGFGAGVDPRIANDSAGLHLTAALPQPQGVGFAARSNIEVSSVTPATAPSSKEPTETPLLCTVPVAGGSSREKPRVPTTVVKLAAESLWPHAGTTREQANKDKGGPESVGDNSVSRLAQYLNLSPRSKVAETRPPYSVGRPSTSCLLPQLVLQSAQPMQRRHCVEAHSLPVSPTPLSWTTQLQPKRAPSKREFSGKKAKSTCVQRTVSENNTACTVCSKITPFCIIRETGGDYYAKFKHRRAWKPQGFLGLCHSERIQRQELSASGGCLDICSSEGSAPSDICLYAGLPPRSPSSSQHTVLPANKVNNAILASMSSAQGEHLSYLNTAHSSFCDPQPCVDQRLDISHVHQSTGSEIEPFAGVPGYTLCSAARRMSTRPSVKPTETAQERSLPHETQPRTEKSESRAVPLPDRTHCMFQTSNKEEDCGTGASTTQSQSGVAPTAITNISREHTLGNLAEVTKAPQASAVASSASACPSLVGPKPCRALQTVAAGGDAAALHVSRTQTDSTAAKQGKVEVTQLSGFSEKRPSSLLRSGEVFRHATSRRKLKGRRVRSVHHHAHIRVPLCKTLQHRVVALTPRASLPESVGPEQVSSYVPLGSVGVDPMRNLKLQRKNSSDQQMFHSRVGSSCPGKPPSSTDNPCRCATGTLWNCFEDQPVWEERGQQNIYKTVHSFPCLASSSLADTNTINKPDKFDGQAVAIRRSKRLEDKGKILERCACRVLHSAGGGLSTRQDSPCNISHTGEGPFESLQRMGYEEAAEGAIHHSHSSDYSVEISEQNSPLFAASSPGGSPALRTDAGTKRRSDQLFVRDKNRGADERPLFSRRKASQMPATVSKSPERRLRRRDRFHREQHNREECLLVPNRFSPAKRKYTEQRSKNSRLSSSRDPPAPAENSAGAPESSPSSSRRQTSASPQVPYFAELLSTLAYASTLTEWYRTAVR